MTDAPQLLITMPRSGVAQVTLDAPQRLNALSFVMFDELLETCRRLDADDAVRAVVLTGAGRAFCAGLDLADASTLTRMTPFEMLRGQEVWAAAVASVHRMRKPVVAAVNGAAAGAGFALALAADIRVADTSSKFNAAFIRIGLSGGDCGSSYFLPRIVGLGHASEILLSGRFVLADEAARIGLVNKVVDPDDLIEAALDVAEQIAQNSPFAVHLTKEIIASNVDAPSLQAALELENRSQVLATRSLDMAEALAAFLEKRPPVFTGE